MSKNDSAANHINTKSSRREFIQQTLRMTAGVYVGMSVIDSFVGPKMGVGGMPLNAATAVGTKPPNDIPPGDLPPKIKELKLKFKELPDEKKKIIVKKIKERKDR